MRNVILNFKEFVSYTPTGIAPGSYVPTTWDNSNQELTTAFRHIGWPSELPEDDFVLGVNPLNIPRTTRKGIVTKFVDKKNPMMVELDDGTKMYLSFDQYKRIKGDLPIVPGNSHLTVVFQRIPHDKSLEVSQIEKIICKFIGNSGLAAQHNVRPNSDALMLNP